MIPLLPHVSSNRSTMAGAATHPERCAFCCSSSFFVQLTFRMSRAERVPIHRARGPGGTHERPVGRRLHSGVSQLVAMARQTRTRPRASVSGATPRAACPPTQQRVASECVKPATSCAQRLTLRTTRSWRSRHRGCRCASGRRHRAALSADPVAGIRTPQCDELPRHPCDPTSRIHATVSTTPERFDEPDCI